jgi:alkanesulfonate monooxygenase SsuD/methylene tetrahydromethanopterin reductase-like flavin-dependent oxidoreductase (luciferase family)
MKFQLAINLERIDDSLDMQEVARHTLEMVQMADEGGFNIVWAAEHHALEMTIAPNPFSILAWWANHTNRIRLGTAVIAAPYWHPIKAAGEAAFLDLISGGRLEFGIGSGAYQREFDRMRPGLKQPVWVAARAPITYDYAVKHGCNIQSWPLTRGMDEAETYMGRMAEAMANNPGKPRPIMAMMRHTALYDRKDEWMVPIRAVQRQLSQFEGLFKNLGDVTNGFPKSIPLDQLGNRAEYDPEMLNKNLMFGTPDEVIEKLKLYQAIGVDEFIYYASLGLGLKEQKRSLELFCKHVIPAFS